MKVDLKEQTWINKGKIPENFRECQNGTTVGVFSVKTYALQLDNASFSKRKS